MKILFLMRHPGAVRNFDAALRLLAERGHHIRLAFENPDKEGTLAAVERLCEAYPNVTRGAVPQRGDDGWLSLGRKLRQAIDYLRYLEPLYQHASGLRARAELRAPKIVRSLAGWPIVRSPAGRRALGRVLRLLERSVPSRPQIEAYLQTHQPDILLVTPLVELGSPQADYIRAARALGVRTGLCVHSWDNLTNKGLIHDPPDLVAVWNAALKEEAVTLHGVPADNVVVTGAHTYDHWFDWSPSTTRDEFCRRVGLPSERPFLLYLCSSPFIAPDEAGFVRGWLGQLRDSDDASLREVGVLVRPHPQHAAQWREVDLSDLGAVAVWPRGGADPVEPQSRADYYDSIYHCAAVVGINTSAQIESAIVGRPVYSLLAPEFRATQEGTIHFHHLLNVSGGLVRAASSFEEHTAQLAGALRNGTADRRDRSFVEAFIRPHGLEVPSAPKLVEAIERTCAAPAPPPRSRPLWAGLLGLLLAVFVYFPQWRRPGPLLRKLTRRAGRLAVRLALKVPPIRWWATRCLLPASTFTSLKLQAELGLRPRDNLAEAERTIHLLAGRTETPILVGPWVGEVGFELL